MHVAGVLGAEQVVEVALDDLDAEPDQVDGLLQVDDAGQRARRRPEDCGGQRAAVEVVVPRLAAYQSTKPRCRPARSRRPRSGPRR